MRIQLGFIACLLIACPGVDVPDPLPAPDAGTLPVDDAGAAQDAGGEPADAGGSAEDAGVLPVDAGESLEDAGEPKTLALPTTPVT